MKPVLFISYYFPPAAGSGVFRALKFAKYLGIKGWKIFVIAGNPDEQRFHDKELLKDLPQTVSVYYTKMRSPLSLLPFVRKSIKGRQHIKESDFFFLPDNKIWWQYEVYELGRKIIEESNIGLIFVTMPPFSASFAGVKLSQRYNIPLILDFRDSWTNNPVRPHLPYLHKKINEHLARSSLNKASFITAAIPEIYEDILEFGVPGEKIKLIMGGYDDEDFQGIERTEKESGKIVITSVGTIYDGLDENYLYSFLEALWLVSGKIQPFEIRLAGGMPKKLKEKLQNLKISDKVKILGYISHNEAIKELVNADYLLLLGRPVPKCDRIFLSKVFEYIRANKPILALVSQFGSRARLLRETGKAFFLPTGSTHIIAELLVEIFNRKEFSEKKFDLSRYSRENMANQLEEIFLSFIS